MWSKALADFLQREYVVAGPKAVPSESRLDFTIVYKIGMRAQKILHWFNRSFFGGFFLITKREVFVSCDGFDENIHIGEDIDYAMRASRHGAYGVVNATVYVSARRAIKYGYLWLLKDFRHIIRLLRTGKMHNSIFYPFGDYREVHTTLKKSSADRG
jgi:GT2 family glycosyltransferase